MKKNIHIFIIIVLIIIIIALLINGQNTRKQFAVQNSFISSYNAIGDSYNSDPNLNQCVENGLHRCMSDIVTNKAVETMDDSICNDLQDAEFKAECIGSLKLVQAIQKEDISLCAELSGSQKYNCEFDIHSKNAREQMDKEICKKIVVPEADVSDSYAVMRYEQAQKGCINDVIIALAVLEVDDSTCSDINDINSQTLCSEKVQYEKDRIAANNDETGSGNNQETPSVDPREELPQ